MLLPTRRIYLNAFKCIMYFVCYVMHDKKIVKQDWIYPIPSQNNIGPLNRFELTFCVLHFTHFSHFAFVAGQSWDCESHLCLHWRREWSLVKRFLQQLLHKTTDTSEQADDNNKRILCSGRGSPWLLWRTSKRKRASRCSGVK